MRGPRTQCRPFKRCFLIFATISLLPLAVIYFVTNNEQVYRIRNFEFNSNNETASLQASHNNAVDVAAIKSKSLSESETEMVEARMVERANHLAEKCAYYGLDVHGNDSLHKPNPWEFLINSKHHLVWCNVFKAASTSWMYNFNILGGYSPLFLKKTNIVPLSLARKKYPRPSVQELQTALNTSVSFLIVRHPFERLLSAYRDKLQFALPHTFHQKLGNVIIRKYRKDKFAKNRTRWPTFSEFTEFLLDEAQHNKELDMHWTEITKFCTPCQVHFDIIAKFETLDEDQKYLIHRAKLENLISPQWKNSGKGKNTQDLLMKYYAELTQKQVHALYELFRYDFELFDYSPKAFFDVAKVDATEPGDGDADKMSKNF